MAQIPKQERGWDLGDYGTNWRCGDTIWFYHANDIGKYNKLPIQGQILQSIICQELRQRSIIIVLVENSIETYPVMLDSMYDLIANDRKTLRRLKHTLSVRTSEKTKRTMEALKKCLEQ